MNWDQAERELLALVKDSRKKLLDQHAERSRGELQAAILTMIHEEAELWQRRAAAGQPRCSWTQGQPSRSSPTNCWATACWPA